jgi:DNA-binding NarL/FixJ family response regulator
MLMPASPCRTYIVYQHGLFAEGLRSVLEHESPAEVVGMERDLAKALAAVAALQPEVVIVEESDEAGQPTHPEAFLETAGVDRVVALSLDHGFATVYDRHRLSAPDPAALIKAIQGVHEAPDSLESSKRAGTDAGRSPDKAPARRARIKESTNKDKAARTSRGKGM